MKKHYAFLRNSVAPEVSLFLCLLTLAGNAQAVDITFTATFQAPTCEVSAPATLDFDTVASAEIKQGTSPELPMDITLSQCAGFIGTTQKPGIKVTGTGTTGTGDFLFRSATSQAVNYGVRITTSTNEVVQNNTFLPAALTSENFDGGSTTIPLTVGLSCGNKCNDAETKSGALNASVTFAFAYQ